MSFKTLLAGSLAVLALVACSGGGGTDNSSTSSSQASSSTSSVTSSSASSSSSSASSASSQAVTGEFKRVGNATYGSVEVPQDFEISENDPNEAERATYGVPLRKEFVSFAVYTAEDVTKEEYSTQEITEHIEADFKELETYKDSKITEATVAGNKGYRITAHFSDGILAEAYVFDHENGNRYYLAFEGKPEFVNQHLQRVLDSWKLQD